jgi:alkaline phosphatase
MVKAAFPTGDHTSVMVPVFSYGPGAEEFIGIMENTDIHAKMKKLLLGN